MSHYGVALETKQAKMRAYYLINPRQKFRRTKHDSMRLLFSSSVSHAKTRQLEWTLAYDQFKQLIAGPCAYGSGMRPDIRIGLDRLDNGKGYIAGNVVPCCARHNQIKSNVFTFDEMRTIALQFSSARNCGNTQGGRRKTHRMHSSCNNGHVLSEDNVYRCSSGRILCRTCSQARVKAWHLKRINATERTE